MLLHEQLTEQIIGAGIEVHRELGPRTLGIGIRAMFLPRTALAWAQVRVRPGAMRRLHGLGWRGSKALLRDAG